MVWWERTTGTERMHMNEFELVRAGVHVDQHDKGNADVHFLVFLVEAKWLANPDCVVSMHVKATYNSASKSIGDITFRGEADVAVEAPLPPWFASFSKFPSTFDWKKASPVNTVKGLGPYLKAFAEKGS